VNFSLKHKIMAIHLFVMLFFVIVIKVLGYIFFLLSKDGSLVNVLKDFHGWSETLKVLLDMPNLRIPNLYAFIDWIELIAIVVFAFFIHGSLIKTLTILKLSEVKE